MVCLKLGVRFVCDVCVVVGGGGGGWGLWYASNWE